MAGEQCMAGELPATAWMSISKHSGRSTQGQLRRACREARGAVDASLVCLTIAGAWPLEVVAALPSSFSALTEIKFVSDKP